MFAATQKEAEPCLEVGLWQTGQVVQGMGEGRGRALQRHFWVAQRSDPAFTPLLGPGCSQACPFPTSPNPISGISLSPPKWCQCYLWHICNIWEVGTVDLWWPFSVFGLCCNTVKLHNCVFGHNMIEGMTLWIYSSYLQIRIKNPNSLLYTVLYFLGFCTSTIGIGFKTDTQTHYKRLFSIL